MTGTRGGGTLFFGSIREKNKEKNKTF